MIVNGIVLQFCLWEALLPKFTTGDDEGYADVLEFRASFLVHQLVLYLAWARHLVPGPLGVRNRNGEPSA